jgi:hypothetical protein
MPGSRIDLTYHPDVWKIVAEVSPSGGVFLSVSEGRIQPSVHGPVWRAEWVA